MIESHDDRQARIAALREQITEQRAEGGRRAAAVAECQRALNECQVQREAWTAHAADVHREHGLHAVMQSAAMDAVGRLERAVAALDAEAAAEALAAEQEAAHAG
jgi:hypothetical protein